MSDRVGGADTTTEITRKLRGLEISCSAGRDGKRVAPSTADGETRRVRASGADGIHATAPTAESYFVVIKSFEGAPPDTGNVGVVVSAVACHRFNIDSIRLITDAICCVSEGSTSGEWKVALGSVPGMVLHVVAMVVRVASAVAPGVVPACYSRAAENSAMALAFLVRGDSGARDIVAANGGVDAVATLAQSDALDGEATVAVWNTLAVVLSNHTACSARVTCHLRALVARFAVLVGAMRDDVHAVHASSNALHAGVGGHDANLREVTSGGEAELLPKFMLALKKLHDLPVSDGEVLKALDVVSGAAAALPMRGSAGVGHGDAECLLRLVERHHTRDVLVGNVARCITQATVRSIPRSLAYVACGGVPILLGALEPKVVPARSVDVLGALRNLTAVRAGAEAMAGLLTPAFVATWVAAPLCGDEADRYLVAALGATVVFNTLVWARPGGGALLSGWSSARQVGERTAAALQDALAERMAPAAGTAPATVAGSAAAGGAGRDSCDGGGAAAVADADAAADSGDDAAGFAADAGCSSDGKEVEGGGSSGTEALNKVYDVVVATPVFENSLVGIVVGIIGVCFQAPQSTDAARYLVAVFAALELLQQCRGKATPDVTGNAPWYRFGPHIGDTVEKALAGGGGGSGCGGGGGDGGAGTPLAHAAL